MSGFPLKPTKCGTVCNFTSVSFYCFDCPALMCSDCKDEMHSNISESNHQILAFTNNILNWQDKNLISYIIDDSEISYNTFNEVSRNINTTKKERFDDDSSNVPGWICEQCTYKNENSVFRCKICSIIRVKEAENNEYDEKLKNFRTMILDHFLDLDQNYIESPEIPFENVVYCYIKDKETDMPMNTWYRQYYPKKKYFSVVNDIIKEAGFSIRLNELDKKYNAILTKRNEKLLQYITNTKIKDEIITSPELNSLNVNSHNKIVTSDLVKDVKDSDLWKVIVKNAPFTKSEKRFLMTEMELQSPTPLELLYAFMRDESLGMYLREECPNGNVKLHHLRQAITDQISIDGAMNFLKKNCQLCSEDYPMPEMRGFLTCEHEYCNNCVLRWLKETIEIKYPCKWSCPNCPDEIYNQVDKNLHYAQLKTFLADNAALINIFESKLLQEQLMKSDNFHWCANEACTNGFEADGIDKIMCPSCKTQMCVKCNRMWQEAHEKKTCQEFEMWMLKNDPNLSKLLKDIGIECPSCGMRYALAPGGCLHFDCKACAKKFCGGCDQFFVDKCNNAKCQMTNFHSHHPRNCLYFLRDYNYRELEVMLKDSDYPRLQGKQEKMCQFMITDDQLKDVLCKKEVCGTTAMCEQHYKEYLVQFINRYKIDPADFVDSNSLNLMLFQMAIDQLKKEKNETDALFKERLKKKVKESCLFYIPKGLIAAEPENI